MITNYPEWTELTLEMRDLLHPRFQMLKEGISEFTFANLYLFRKTYGYSITRVENSLYIFSGRTGNKRFFMLPFGLPPRPILDELFTRFDYIKGVSENQVETLAAMGCRVEEDRDNFDYLYLRKELAELNGRKYHKKRTHINSFLQNYSFRGAFIVEQTVNDAMYILNAWRAKRDRDDDYAAAREALELMDTLQLCGSMVYVEDKPAAYTIGEELAAGICYAVHFEKAISEYKGVYQFINQCFAALLPEKYVTINREQDLGDAGLRKAKMSYNPCGFVKKYKVYPV